MKGIVVISGVTSGVGFETAKLLLKNDYGVIGLVRKLALVPDELKKHTEFTPIKCDITKIEDVENAFNLISEEVKDRVIAIVNNAGCSRGRGPFHETSVEDWREMVETNLMGALYLTATFLPIFIKKREGLIINIGSVAGIDGYPKGGVYVATKHAIRGFSKALRYDVSQYGIRVSHIAPGIIDTPFHIKKHKDPEYVAEMLSGYTPLKPEDIAKAVLFILEMPPHVCVSEIVIYPVRQVAPGVILKEENKQ